MKRVFLLLLLHFAALFSFAQFSVSGVVKNEAGEILPGTNVILNGSYKGMPADEQGRFQFSRLKAGNYTLQASFIGYSRKEIAVLVNRDREVEITLSPSGILTEEVLVEATRAGDRTPVAKTTLDKAALEERNMGQDIPYLLTMTPSFVASSDAGTGIGYTNFRIRGTDVSRINVTINGIPMNDAESHGTWFVDVPDMAESSENIQVQRGVGTSANGAAAFGASLNLQTNTLNKKAYARYKTSAGSYHTFKNTVSAGSGLMNDHFSMDVRLSKVSSDGFIDRGSSDLKSFFVSTGYFSEKTIVRMNAFAGIQETYQAWNGVPSVRLHNDEAGMNRYRDHWLWSSNSERENLIRYEDMLSSDSRAYNLYTYENEVDHYQQNYYQLHFSHQFNPSLHLNASFFLTQGKGYYENFDYDEKYADYNMIAPSEGAVTDLVKRKWLGNDLYGGVFSLHYERGKSSLTFGGGYHTYDGDHFGNVIWAANYGANEINHEWYRGKGLKKDFNIYGKYLYQVSVPISLFADLQYRRIDYDIDGIDDDLRDVGQSHHYHFFNPKAGIYYRPDQSHEAYLSYGRANREPTRSNFIDADPNGKQPVSETLNDFEAGYTYKASRFLLSANLYYMTYNDQLIQTGEINDVGTPIMVNVDKSYRTGIEMSGGFKISGSLNWDVHATFSRNKIKNFTEYIDNWDKGEQDAFDLGKTDLAFSPAVTVNSHIRFKPHKALNISLLSNYVSDQYIDNTSSDDRKLNAWSVSNLKADYQLKNVLFEDVKLHLMINNLFDEEYESNAWVYSYLYGGGRYKMDGYFPQAGIHFLAGITIRF
ncbi:MAG: TonB-dependent receptor [Mangrovibacterium sp.]|nr:TonB-dependent receptor [Mangrovibacterium sp.]